MFLLWGDLEERKAKEIENCRGREENWARMERGGGDQAKDVYWIPEVRDIWNRPIMSEDRNHQCSRGCLWACLVF